MAHLAVDLEVALPALTVTAAFEVGAQTVALVGPSGAGKTTVLRAIAGLARMRRGRIVADGATWAGDGLHLPPQARSVGMVFQDYALFPHLSARANVAFGGGDPGAADALLERFGIPHLAASRPGTFSGGERQRVALARALARDPQVLLLDEPLSALDTDTRLQVRTELADLLVELGLPTVVVTHDHRDALVLADRIGVIVGGRLLQLDTASALAAQPAAPFVVTFTGGDIVDAVGRADGSGSALELPGGATARTTRAVRGPVQLGTHPWRLAVDGTPDAWTIDGTVESAVDEGGRTRLQVGGLSVFAQPDSAGGRTVPQRGSRVTLTAPLGAVHVFDDSQEPLREP